MSMHRAIYALSVALTILSGCAGPVVGGRELWINEDYTESQLFYLETMKPVRANTQQYFPLLSPTEAIDPAMGVEERAPVTVFAQGVRLPKNAPSSFYAVVVVHVQIVGSPNETEPVIVGAFPNAKPGVLLPFRSLRVFGQDTWKPESPWEFHVQVLDFREKQNEAVLRAINQIEATTQRLNKVAVFSDPVIQIAIDGAKALAQQPNRSVIDFKLGMYSIPQVGNAANVLPLMRKGAWLVCAKSKDSDPSFWEQAFVMNDRSRVIYAGDPQSTLAMVDLPYLEVAIGAFATQPGRSKVADDVSSLLGVVLGPRWEQDPGAVLAGANGVWSRTQVEMTLNRFEQTPGEEAFGKIVSLLTARDLLQPHDRDRLAMKFRAVLKNARVNDDAASVAEWWADIGAKGSITNGFWVSPVQQWIDELNDRKADDYTFLKNRDSYIPQLLAAASGKPLSQTTTVAESVPGGASKTLGISEAEQAWIVNFFSELRRSWDPRRGAISSSSELTTWWTNEGSLGEIYRDDTRSLRWRSFVGGLAQRMREGNAQLADLCFASSLLSGKVLQQPAPSSVWSESDRRVFEQCKSTMFDVEQNLLREGLSAMTQRRFQSIESVERWWADVGRLGSVEGKEWTSPVDESTKRFWSSGSLSDWPQLLNWFGSPAVTDAEKRLIAIRLVPCGDAASGEAPVQLANGGWELRANQWIAFVDAAQVAYKDKLADCLEAHTGVCQFTMDWCTGTALSSGVPKHAIRVGVLYRTLLSSDRNFEGREKQIEAGAEFFKKHIQLTIDGAVQSNSVPGSDEEWKRFMQSLEVMKDTPASERKWRWSRPKAS